MNFSTLILLADAGEPTWAQLFLYIIIFLAALGAPKLIELLGNLIGNLGGQPEDLIAQNQRMKDFALVVVRAAEQWALAEAKMSGGPAKTAAEKLDWAIEALIAKFPFLNAPGARILVEWAVFVLKRELNILDESPHTTYDSLEESTETESDHKPTEPTESNTV